MTLEWKTEAGGGERAYATGATSVSSRVHNSIPCRRPANSNFYRDVCACPAQINRGALETPLPQSARPVCFDYAGSV